MPKSVLSLYVDTDLIERAKLLKMNMSKEFTNYLRFKLEQNNPFDNINKSIDTSRIEKDINELTIQISTSINNLNLLKKALKDIEKENENKQERLDKELFK